MGSMSQQYKNQNKKISDEQAKRIARGKFIRHQRRLHTWTVILCLILSFYLVAGVTGIFIIKDLTKDIPTLKVNDFIGDESSQIYDGNGNLLVEVGTYYRENIEYKQMPESVIDAFLSIEDSRFFSHNGFDLPRFTASAIKNVLSGNLRGQGGSTFTMQLVKNSYFTSDDGNVSDIYYQAGGGIKYKVQQIILAMKLEKSMTKQEIFQLYLNRLNFGQNIRGIEMASRYYFGKNTSQLNLSESALLAGIVNMPNTYNPYYYLDFATARRDQVLDMMAYHGYISEEERDLAKSVKVEDELVGEYADIETNNSQYQEYIDVVLNEAQAMTGYDPYNVGMKIYTALNPDLQTLVQDIEAGNTSVVYGDDLMQSAITVIDHTNGELVALGGGRNYGANGGSRLLNRATSMYKQPGSTVKPILSYALGFEYLGYSIDETIPDYKYSYPGESRVIADYDGQYKGIISIKDATADSRNIPAIITLQHVQEKIGTEKIVEYMQNIGFDSVTAENFHLSTAIGAEIFTSTVTQLAAAHATIMNLGVYNAPHTIRSVTLSTGDTYYPENQNVRVISSGSAYLSTELMRNNVAQTNYYNYMQILKRSWPVFAKTGTTDYDDSFVSYGIPEGVAKDEWMVASNSRYTNAVWTGWDQAVDGGNTYFTSYKLNLNTAGRINSLLIDKEAEVSEDASGSIAQPEDVVSVSYVKNTWPHVAAGKARGSTITSLVSSTGLENQPLVNSMSESYRVTSKGYSKGLNYDSYSSDDDENETKENLPTATPTPTPQAEVDTEIPTQETPEETTENGEPTTGQ